MADEEILADVKTEGEPVTLEPEEEVKEEGKEEKTETKEKETPSESPTEETKTEESPASDGGESKEVPEDSSVQREEKPSPFHKDPRYQRFQQRYKENEAELEELRENQAKLEQQLQDRQQSNEPIPNWIQEQFGDNPQYWKGLQDYVNTAVQKGKQEILAEQQQVAQQQTQQTKYWEQWVEDEIMKVEEQQSIDLSQGNERNAYLKFMSENRPTSEDGNLDFQRGWNLYTQLKPKPEPAAKKKEIAAATMEEGKGEAKKKDYLTPNDLKGVGWDEIDNVN